MHSFKMVDLPDTSRPPFWRAVSAEDFRAKCGAKATIPGGLDGFRPGWSLAYFSVRVLHERMTDVGWVRNGFALSAHPVDGGLVFSVTHLASGKKIALCDTQQHAAELVETIETIPGWSEVTVVDAPRPVLDSYFATLAAAGFVEELKEMGGACAAVLWTRKLAS